MHSWPLHQSRPRYLEGGGSASAFDDFGPGCGDRTRASIAFTTDSKWNDVIVSGPDAGLTVRQAIEAGRNDWVGHEVRHWKGPFALGAGGATFEMRWKPSWMLNGALAVTNCPGTELLFNDERHNELLQGTTSARGLGAHE